MECLTGLVLHWADWSAECTSEIRNQQQHNPEFTLCSAWAAQDSSGKCLAVQQQYNPNELADLGLQNWQGLSALAWFDISAEGAHTKFQEISQLQ